MRAAVAGAVVGLIASVLPLELLGLTLAPAFGVWLWHRNTSRAPHVRRALLVAAACGVACVFAPLKYPDRNRVSALSTECATLDEVSRAFPRSPAALPEGSGGLKICFSSKEPTLREVEQVAAGQGLRLELRYCGNGASLLFGASPLRFQFVQM